MIQYSTFRALLCVLRWYDEPIGSYLHDLKAQFRVLLKQCQEVISVHQSLEILSGMPNSRFQNPSSDSGVLS